MCLLGSISWTCIWRISSSSVRTGWHWWWGAAFAKRFSARICSLCWRPYRALQLCSSLLGRHPEFSGWPWLTWPVKNHDNNQTDYIVRPVLHRSILDELFGNLPTSHPGGWFWPKNQVYTSKTSPYNPRDCWILSRTMVCYHNLRGCLVLAPKQVQYPNNA